jgi:hypothetical protein
VRHGGNWSVLQKNLAAIADLKRTQGHWGGIHAVYNIYNATRICELHKFAEQTGNTVLWQNLFQPEYLDPFLHGPVVAQEAIAEIERFYAMGIATPAERSFFDQALRNYQAVEKARPGIEYQFAQHIQAIENQYHPDSKGKFATLWPELASLCQ